jgi:site-specific DNA-methyltransferase (adenine-specific)
MNLDTIVCADALTFLAALPSASVDMVLCDLPYQMTSLSWDEIIPFAPMWEQFRRVTKPRAAIVLTASQPFTSKLVMSNLEMFKYEIIWEKGRDRIANYAMQNMMPGKIHESVLVFSAADIAHNSKTKMVYNPIGAIPVNKSRTFDYGGSKGGSHLPNRQAKRVQGVQKFTNYPTTIWKIPFYGTPTHPTQKPDALFERLIRTYTQPDEIVLDCCIGSGTTAIAARNTGRRLRRLDDQQGRRRTVSWEPFASMG